MASCIQNLDVPTTVAYILATVNIVQGLAALIGNFIVFFIIIKSKRLHTRSTICLMSLATTDLLVGLVLEPIYIMQLSSKEYSSNCRFNSVRRFLATLFMGASIGSIAVVSYDRYQHLSKTLNYKECMPKKRIACLLIIAWMVPLATSLTRFINEIFYRVVVIVYISTIITIMITCYIFVIRIVKNGEDSLRMVKRAPTGSQNRIDSQRKSREMGSHIKTAKAVIVIIAILFVTFAPILIYFVIGAFSSLLERSILMSVASREVGYACCMTVAMANSAVNPVIYCLRIPEFRASLKKRYARSLCPRYGGASHNEVNDSKIVGKGTT